MDKFNLLADRFMGESRVWMKFRPLTPQQQSHTGIGTDTPLLVGGGLEYDRVGQSEGPGSSSRSVASPFSIR